MANDFIKCNTSDTNAYMAADVVTASRQTRQLMDSLKSIVDRGSHLFAAANFAPFEAACGLQPGQGQTVYDTINGAYLAMTGAAQNPNAVALKDRIG